ncbi:MAG: hypothetical protein KDI30_10265 [Pseudomonadales bacterium]|nr:hypothetical protein [Pseudomonadales bacterium]
MDRKSETDFACEDRLAINDFNFASDLLEETAAFLTADFATRFAGAFLRALAI